MDDSQDEMETQPPARPGAPGALASQSAASPDAADTPASETTSLGDRVQEVREHLERSGVALAALDQLLPAGTSDQTGGRDRR